MIRGNRSDPALRDGDGLRRDATATELVSSDAGGGVPSIGPAVVRPPDRFLLRRKCAIWVGMSLRSECGDYGDL